ncbi:cytochrome P450 4g15 isoform X1 [Belonocnema kinseyi]|uniref:cytochrome P450 4g15 isoform X1 n=1 Tax=Belonocnema kinseyi TaxID=2817044 RepID=UPI00143D821C|nr:cytochrome P450 4g15 isoform X1 [Belonocnema kinseyi]
MSAAGPEVVAGSVAAASATGLSATTVFLSLLLPALALYYVYFRISRRHMLELAAKIPGPPGLPIVGNALEFMGSSDAIFRKFYERSFEFDQVIKIWIGPKLVVFLVDPRDVEVILSSNVYIDKSSEYRFFQPWLGNGLLISTGQKWRAHRKLIAPTFHLNVLKSFIDLFNANSRSVVERMRKEGQKEFDIHDYMSETTVEILLETAMGVSKSTQDKSGFEYAMAVMKMCDILHLRHTRVWLRPDWLFNLTKYSKDQMNLLEIIHGLTKKVIKRKKEEYKSGKRTVINPTIENRNNDKDSKVFLQIIVASSLLPMEVFLNNIIFHQSTTVVEGLSFGQSSGLKDDLDVDDNDVGEKKRLAFLDLLVESAQNGVVLNDQEVKEQVDTIMFEGHDTTAAGSSFFLSMMGCHPDIQEKVIQELDEIFGDSDRPATFQDTLEMKYLERCLMETLRMYPPVPIIARELKTDLKLVSGDYTVPAGCTVVVATLKLHRQPNIYPNPDVFDPDNFLPEKTANRHYYAFVPFSAGPRSCVGRKYAMLKLKILLSTILRNFRVQSTVKEADFRLQADIILKRAEGFKVKLEPRKSMAMAH